MKASTKVKQQHSDSVLGVWLPGLRLEKTRLEGSNVHMFFRELKLRAYMLRWFSNMEWCQHGNTGSSCRPGAADQKISRPKSCHPSRYYKCSKIIWARPHCREKENLLHLCKSQQCTVIDNSELTQLRSTKRSSLGFYSYKIKSRIVVHRAMLWRQRARTKHQNAKHRRQSPELGQQLDPYTLQKWSSQASKDSHNQLSYYCAVQPFLACCWCTEQYLKFLRQRTICTIVSCKWWEDFVSILQINLQYARAR